METLKIGLLYLALHNQLIKKCGINGIVSRKEFFVKLGRHGQVPQKLRDIVLKEMEEKELIKKVNRDYLQILPLDINIESDEECKDLFQKMGIY